MVQRKAPQQAEEKRSHVKLETQSSFQQQQQQQDTRSRGGGDLKKKMKMERSIIAADLESLQGFSMNPKKTPSSPPKNYMKPTSSWNARKERLQVTIHPQITTDMIKNRKSLHSSKPSCSSSIKTLKSVRPSLMKKSLKGVVVNRATCSSTLKDAKFPKALDLSPGGTEAEGTSAKRVCPYTYCSLNGHGHEPLPPLKCFMSSRRKLLKTQKSIKLKGLYSFKVKGLGKDSKGIDTGQKAKGRCSSTEELSKDFFVEIYTSKPEEEIKTIIETGMPRLLGESRIVGDDGGHVDSEIGEDECPNDSYSDVSYEDDGVHWNSGLSDEEAKEENNLNLLLEDFGELHVESCKIDISGKDDAESGNEVSTLDFDCEEIESLFRDNVTECSETEHPLPTQDDDENYVLEHDDPEVGKILADGDSGDNGVNMEGFVKEQKVTSPEGSIGNKSKVGMHIVRRKMTEDLEEEMKEFNPRGPNFLPVEPDPDAEHVDLRHQIMDERKDSEEWMIDYALRRAVMKLAPAPKKKVAVLVEAFETVLPPAWEKPLQHTKSGFPHARIIQSCN